MANSKSQQQAKEQIFEAINEYYHTYLKEDDKPFEGGKDSIRYAGRIFDENELINGVDSILEFWLTAGRFTRELEDGLKEYLGIKYAALVNSGSSANLLAFHALTSPLVEESRRLRKGDEVITAAAAFPTTITPILQFGAVPVFLDIRIPNYNMDIALLEEALTERTKAVFIAHTLGNPFNLKEIKAFCDRYRLWLIEDNCDALGAEYTIGA